MNPKNEKGLEDSSEPIGISEILEEVLHRCVRDYISVAMGAFLPEGCPYMRLSDPAILISPERVEDEATALSSTYSLDSKETFAELLKAVLAHELGHAYTFTFIGDTSLYYRKMGFRTLEETIAQLFAFTNIGEKDRVVMTLESRRQSAEYRSWFAYSKHAEEALGELLGLYDLTKAVGYIKVDSRCITRLWKCLRWCAVRAPISHYYWCVEDCISNIGCILPVSIEYLAYGVDKLIPPQKDFAEVLYHMIWRVLLERARVPKSMRIDTLAELYGIALLISGALVEPKP